METTSPYTTPKAEILSNQEEYGSIKILSVKGRIGRLRYIGYSIGISLFVYLVMGVLVGLVGTTMSEEAMGPLMLLVLVLGIGSMFFINIVLMIQRCHDINMSGWLSLSLLIPLVPLIFWFIPGTEGVNKYGPPPPPNRSALLIIMIILVMVVLLGVLAAIAIPAYQDYVARATAAGM
jgi:uncharacterized membrane protein YhaH (DUF805 family)